MDVNMCLNIKSLSIQSFISSTNTDKVPGMGLCFQDTEMMKSQSLSFQDLQFISKSIISSDDNVTQCMSEI